MFTTLVGLILSNILYLVLHVKGNGSFPRPLTAAEEKKYLTLLRENNDTEARGLLIEHNLRLVAHIIKKYYSSQYDQDDLISIGTIGLIKAVSSFDDLKGTRLATYAARCIENEILMYFRNQKKSAQDIYMSDPIDTDKDGNALTLIDVIADDGDIIDNLDIKIKSEKLSRYIKEVLSDREQLIIKLRYGLDGSDELTQREVAKLLKISRSYVSRIEKKSLGLLLDKFKHEKKL